MHLLLSLSSSPHLLQHLLLLSHTQTLLWCVFPGKQQQPMQQHRPHEREVRLSLASSSSVNLFSLFCCSFSFSLFAVATMRLGRNLCQILDHHLQLLLFSSCLLIHLCLILKQQQHGSCIYWSWVAAQLHFQSHTWDSDPLPRRFHSSRPPFHPQFFLQSSRKTVIPDSITTKEKQGRKVSHSSKKVRKLFTTTPYGDGHPLLDNFYRARQTQVSQNETPGILSSPHVPALHHLLFHFHPLISATCISHLCSICDIRRQADSGRETDFHPMR